MRKLVLAEAQHHQRPVQDEAVTERLGQFRHECGIMDDISYQNWLQLNDISRQRLADLIKDLVIEEDFYGELSRRTGPDCIDTLRLRNEYFKWIHRYERKRAYLEDKGLTNPSLDHVGCAEQDLLNWYFREHGIAMPADVRAYAISRGFHDEHSFLQAILMEFIYSSKP